MLVTAQRAAHKQVGDVFAARRCVASWLGCGTFNGPETYLTDYALAVRYEDHVSRMEEPFSECDQFLASGWYTAEEVRNLVKQSEVTIERARIWHEATANFASALNAPAVEGVRPMVIHTNHLEERTIAAASAQLPENWSGPCVRYSTVAQRVEEHKRRKRAAFDGPKSPESEARGALMNISSVSTNEPTA